MRVVVCDTDTFMQEMVESVAASAGHEVVGVASDTASAEGLLKTARPDVAIIDVALGVATDFDLVRDAANAGARVIVFSQQVDVDLLDYERRPQTVVFKPDFRTLEDVLRNVGEKLRSSPSEDRRHRPSRAADGPPPRDVSDAQAFYEAVNNALGGDALVAFDVPVGAEDVADDVYHRLRDTDRVLLSLPRAVRCFLPAGGDEGIRSVLSRVAGVSSLSDDCTATAVIVHDGEHGADAFDRLKKEGAPRPLR